METKQLYSMQRRQTLDIMKLLIKRLARPSVFFWSSKYGHPNNPKPKQTVTDI